MKNVVFCLILLGLSISIFGQEDKISKPKWEFDVAPYLWLAGSSGTISSINQSTNIDANFKDILKNLKFGVFMHLEAKKGKWIAFGDIVYVEFDKTARTEMTTANIELKQTVAEIGGGYNLITTLDDWLSIDALAGLRYFEIGNRIIDNQQQTLNTTINVSDPFVGIRFSTTSDKWINGARIDVGGFGIGSNISWKANLLIGYQCSELLSLSFGYQAYGIDYEKNEFRLYLISSGFVTGLNFHF